ncbi:fumarylacetoacetate hydrolase family protein [Bacillus solitudinis]|uniref:fumarylacetoacetate hydrolase family protein n=1 Tax=Bacillus solitudinis TaxID=2014074 RepID=UPI0022284498|nr:fumarylacetoacetate hydrolase family protein [Bacillus solitudinis]
MFILSVAINYLVNTQRVAHSMPGDIILTGTPEGVILGLPKDEQIYLKAGDEVTVEIEIVGSLTNYFIKEEL